MTTSLHKTMTCEPDQLLLSYRQAAKLLACSERLVWELVHDGKIPVVRLGKRAVRIRRQALEAWVAEQEKAQSESSAPGT